MKIISLIITSFVVVTIKDSQIVKRSEVCVLELYCVERFSPSHSDTFRLIVPKHWRVASELLPSSGIPHSMRLEGTLWCLHRMIHTCKIR